MWRCFAPVAPYPDTLRVFLTGDGSPSLLDERLGVSYHSKYGAWQETQHVFIRAGLGSAAADRSRVAILDVGFGTGLNAFASLRVAAERSLALDYVTVEAFPLSRDTVDRLEYPRHLDWPDHEAQLWRQLHDLPWDTVGHLRPNGSPAVTFEKRRTRLEDLTDSNRFDLVYYDAFAPEAQPELWTPGAFALVGRALRPGGTLVTYCAKGQVKRDLRAVGFETEALPGPPGKREMTRATWRGRPG